MTNSIFHAAFLIGAAVVIWMGGSFVGTSVLALAMITLIGAVYGLGFFELIRYRAATRTLDCALAELKGSTPELDGWLARLHSSLTMPVRLRIEGERVALPQPVMAPYLVGLLVMLGLLGTFAGMVGTLKGAVFALEGTTELQAIREGLAAPMKGLGLAFGTSVAGVAASAMLGLLSTICRRERHEATRLLDKHIISTFKPHSLSYNRQQTYQAMQQQAEALPQLVDSLGEMTRQMTEMSKQFSADISDSQARFHEESRNMLKELTDSVGESLKASLAESGRMAGEAIEPVVSAAMQSMSSTVAEHAEASHTKMADTATNSLQAMNETLVGFADRLGTDLAERTEQAESQRREEWESVFKASHESLANQVTEQTAGVVATLKSLSDAQVSSVSEMGANFERISDKVLQDWETSGSEAIARQDTLSEQLERVFKAIESHALSSQKSLSEQSAKILSSSEQLVDARMQSEVEWQENQKQRIDDMANQLRDQLSALHDQEANRGDAALQRLSTLEERVGEHLAQLGNALEAPMSRLIESASEAPKAAAEVIDQLRESLSENLKRDNELLAERSDLVSDLNQLFSNLEQSATRQSEAIDNLVERSEKSLTTLGEQFATNMLDETNKLQAIGDHFSAGASELASLGDAFSESVNGFNEANQSLLDGLNRIEVALDQSSVRADEQLGYYVAQAKELIDHSMLSQREIFEALRQLSTSESSVEQVG